MDGFEFCRALRNIPELTSTPFLFLTGAYVSDEDEDFALKIGASRFLRRPFSNQVFLNTVQELMSTPEIVTAMPDLDERSYLKEHVNRLTSALEDKIAELETVMEQNVRLLKDAKRNEEELQKSLTELKHTQSYLVQSERLSAVGQLVAGVAHELNNPLAIILGYSQLMLRMPEITPRMQECLRKLEDAAQRCQRIVHHLTLFAQKQKSEKREIDLNELLRSVVDIRGDQFHTDKIRLVSEFSSNELMVMADFQQLQQVFLSVINNAQEALIGHNRPDRTIRMASHIDNDRAVVEIIDNGPGIPDDLIPKLFEPFFTTKDFGKGIGLGLSVCYGIIREHNGDIQVSPTEGGGATFIVTLPLSGAAAPTPDPDHSREESSSSAARRRILIIDDEPGILDILSSALTEMQYSVDTALRGADAVELIFRAPYDLVLLDIRLPDTDGKTLYQNILIHRPELRRRIAFLTGDTVSPDTLTFIEKTGNPLITKPFDIARLPGLLAEMLSAL
jgi:two-component system NtrC family sensor kinase